MLPPNSNTPDIQNKHTPPTRWNVPFQNQENKKEPLMPTDIEKKNSMYSYG